MDDKVPPIYSAPPPLGSTQRPPSPSSGRGWIWLAAALVIGLVLILFIVAKFADAVRTVSFGGPIKASRARLPVLEELVVENNGSKNKIAIIDIEGIITSQSWDRSGSSLVDLVDDALEMAANDGAVRAVILKVDSPGGEVLASDDISQAIAEFQETSGKPVIAAMGSLAASGGYYVSAPCRWIVANELTITGSIGVIMHSLNYRGLMDKVGLYPQVFKSGRYKDMLSGTKRPEDVDPQEREMVQTMIDQTFEKFKSVVAEGRKRAEAENESEGRGLVENWLDYADGRVLTGKQAYEVGFVDELGSFDVAVTRAKSLANVQNANLIRYQRPFDISRLFGIFGETESKGLKVDLGMDIPKLQAGKMYFLSPTVLNY